jgi:hypothetical protein
VGSVTLKPVTAGNRTFWHWESTFSTSPGREREFGQMVAEGVYEAGFENLRRHLLQGGDRRLPVAAPGVLGMEAAGTVTDVGDGVTGFLPGDRVAYLGPLPGAYCCVRTVPAGWVVRLPAAVDDETAAALLLKGLTADMLLRNLAAWAPAPGCWCTRPPAAPVCSCARGRAGWVHA